MIYEIADGKLCDLSTRTKIVSHRLKHCTRASGMSSAVGDLYANAIFLSESHIAVMFCASLGWMAIIGLPFITKVDEHFLACFKVLG